MPQPAEGVMFCGECGERVPDPLLLALLRELKALREQVGALAAARAPVNGDRHLVDAIEVARLLGVSRDFVYEHADELGAVRLGDGEKPRLRFDPARARQLHGAEERRPTRPNRPRPRISRGELLPIAGTAPATNGRKT